MKERPILFSAPMVRSILAGTKTQTRRIVKPQPKQHQEMRLAVDAPGRSDADWFLVKYDVLNTWVPVRCPYGAPGDRLWVKETWRTSIGADAKAPSEMEVPGGGYGWPVWYAADGGAVTWRGSSNGGPAFTNPGKTRVSIHMPRWASRITLEVTGVRVERLHAITDDDARAEGISRGEFGSFGVDSYTRSSTPRRAFQELWQAISGAESWDANPWVWVVEFRRVEAAQVTP